MKMGINRVKQALAIVWCAGLLLLGGCSGTGEGTWKQEYESCMAAMEQGISEYDITGEGVPYENLPDYAERARHWSMELWQDSLRAFGECVETCIRNQPGGVDGEQDVYRTATLLMAAMSNKRQSGSYGFSHEHGEDMEKAQEDFKAIIERGNPIDESIKLFYEEFGSYYYVDFVISAMLSEAWQEEFYHCLELVRDRVKQSGAAGQEQLLEALEAWEDFYEVWADNEEKYEWIEGASKMHIDIAESRAEVFRIGTMLLINGLERSGGSYEFIYDSEPDRQALIHNYTDLKP